MRLEYICRYCHSHLGSIDREHLSDQQLGFDRLTPEERADIITSNMNGTQQVRIICETCQQTLEENPDLYLLPQLYQ